MMYNDYSRKQLLDRIKELELLNFELRKEKEQEAKLDYAWTGNLGHWYWNLETNNVTFNPLKVTTLGYNMDEVPEHVTYQFFTDKLHPEDHSKTMDAMLAHLYGKAEVYEVEYRIKTKDGKYKWYYDRGKITQFNENGKPLFVAGIVFDITEKKEIQLELEHKNEILIEMSSLDGLTKVSNHRTLIERLKAGILDLKVTNNPLSIVIFDIDDFKKVNDSKGHVFGDRILVETAKIIKSSVRDADVVGRYGGEEFMVIYSDTDLKKAQTISDRIRQSIETFSFSEGIRITISGGVKQYDGEETSELIHLADMNLYKAKNKGKNQVV